MAADLFVRNVRLPDPGFIEYLVLDRYHVSVELQPLVERLTAPGGEFEALLDTENVLVARRVRPPARVPEARPHPGRHPPVVPHRPR